ncbi:NAD(+)/NADH kinase [Desulfurivibrio dismutans]|uniref:NAD(+)/NADH kinase n=1 Tax=Desulfurivibrio dismutans TaxID=1398908 RepID=UPI0023DB1BA2|nr:NAD(+)/NADH kinase [Desulfurivibrio alkaliphilus]MDF1614779.1 NAD(+)/NADH kinase [Desulfurivibrio alkaliphilus]
MKLGKVGIILKRDSAEPRRIGGEMADWFAARGIDVSVDRIEADQDLLIILGGDGTLLHVAAEAGGYEIPVLGINMGGLGFLTEVAVEDRWAILERLLSEELPVEERMMLKIRLRSEAAEGWHQALNDVVISKGAVDRMVELEAWADGEYLATYRADGLIIASSTGSTAYNLSAGGPVVHPRLDAIVVTPICPFMLESRPVLLTGSCRLEVRIAESSTGTAKVAANLQVIADGHRCGELRPGDILEIAAADRKLRLVTSPWKGYFEILRGKLNWSGGR